jgi:hypothetical protein
MYKSAKVSLSVGSQMSLFASISTKIRWIFSQSFWISLFALYSSGTIAKQAENQIRQSQTKVFLIKSFLIFIFLFSCKKFSRDNFTQKNKFLQIFELFLSL